MNLKNNSSYAISSDASYIDWCLINLKKFLINPDELEALQDENCYYFYGVNISKTDKSNIYTYTPIIGTSKLKFTEKAILKNQTKYRYNLAVLHDKDADDEV